MFNRCRKKWLVFCVLPVLVFSIKDIYGQESQSLQQFQYALKLMDDGLEAIAVTQFEEFLELYPDSPNVPAALFQLGFLLQKTGDYEKSSSKFRLLLVKYPDYPDCDNALYNIAQNFLKAGEMEQSIGILERFSLFYPKSSLTPRAYLDAGDYWLKLNKFSQAEESWQFIINEYPQSQIIIDSRLRLGRLYFLKEDYNLAQVQIDRILDLSTEKNVITDVSILKARILTKQYKIDDAEQLYKQVLEGELLPAGQIKVKLSLADFYNTTGRPQLAKQELAPLIPEQSESTLQDSIIFVWLESLYQLGEDDTLITALNSYYFTFDDSLIMLAGAELGIKSAVRCADFSAAIEFLQKRLAFEKQDISENSRIKNYRLELLRQLRGDQLFADAVQYGQSVLKLDWQDNVYADRIRYELARIYQVDLDQPRQALFYYEQILAPSHKSRLADEAAFFMAACYESLKDETVALRIYRNFTKTFPGSPLLSKVTDKLDWYQIYRPENPTQQINTLSALLLSSILEENPDKSVFTLITRMFEDFKDYRGVVELNSQVEAKNILQSYRDRLNQIVGESFFRLAMAEEKNDSRFELLDKARRYLLQYIAALPNNSEQLRIALLVFDIDRYKNPLTTMDFLDEYDFLTKLKSKFYDLAEIKYLNLRLARLLHDYGIRAAKDSIISAISYYDNILADSNSVNKVSVDDNFLKPVLFGFTGYPEEESLYFRGQAYITLEDTNRALLDLRRYIDFYPRGKFIVAVSEKLGQLNVKQKKWIISENIYSNLSRRFYYSQVSDSANIQLAQIKIVLGKNDEAIKLLEPFQDQKTGLYFLGRAYQNSRQYLKAREVYNKYLKLYKNGEHVADIYLHLADMAEKTKQKKEAANYHQQFLDRFPDDSRKLDILELYADQQFEDGNYTAALKSYSDLITDSTQNINLEKKRIICFVRLGNLSAARISLENFSKEQKKQPEIIAQIEYEIGDYYLLEKSFKLAEDQFKNVISKYKRTEYAIYAQFGLGKLKLVTNHTDEGLDILTKIPGEYPDHPVLSQLYLTLGDYYYKTKQFGNAGVALNKVLELNPVESLEIVTRKYLIKIYSDTGQYERSLGALREFLKKFPDDENAFVYKIDMGVTLFNLNEFDRAIDHLRSLIPLADNDHEAEIRFWIGKSYSVWGQHRKAISEYLALTYLTKPTNLPWHVSADYESGLAFMKIEEWDNAKDLFNKIIKKEGAGSSYGRFALAKLREVEQLQQN